MIFIQLFILILGIFALSNSLPLLDGRIVGGVPVRIETVPYQVSIQFFGQHHCGGSLIAPDIVLSAAHCFSTYLTFLYAVCAGSTYTNSGGVLVTVSEINLHPQYDPQTINNDIALVKLTKLLRLSGTIQLARLPKLGEEPRVGSIAVTSGWGRLYENGPIPNQLQAVEVYIRDRYECSILNEIRIPMGMICADNARKDTCQGDSGGPLMVEGKQIGIVSWGKGCARPGNPGIYTNLHRYYDFYSRYLS